MNKEERWNDGRISDAELASASGINKASMKWYLRELCDRNLIIGGGRGTRYKRVVTKTAIVAISFVGAVNSIINMETAMRIVSDIPGCADRALRVAGQMKNKNISDLFIYDFNYIGQMDEDDGKIKIYGKLINGKYIELVNKDDIDVRSVDKSSVFIIKLNVAEALMRMKRRFMLTDIVANNKRTANDYQI